METTKYIKKCLADAHDHAAVPIPIAADYLEVTREAVSERIRNGSLKAISVKGKDRRWKLVLISSLHQAKKTEGDEMTDKIENVRELLENAASLDTTVNYGTLMSKVGLSYRNPQHRKLIGTILGEISEATFDDDELGFMLSAIAVGKSTNYPNDAFFDLAVMIGAMDDDDDPEDFWDEQMHQIFKHYSAP